MLIIGFQCRLIILQKPDLIAALSQNLNRYRPLGEHRITTNYPSLAMSSKMIGCT
jgi:hypothetical protein